MTISAVIPCHMVEGHIAACLNSVLAQEEAVQEIICVDDGSTDGTVAAIRALQVQHPGRITLLQCEHKGASAARNTGLATATGTYIQFLDADDLLLPGKLSGQAAMVQAETGPDLIVGDYMVDRSKMREHIHALAGEPWMGLIKTRIGSTCSNLWKRSAVLDAGAWDDSLASSQDHDLIFRMLCKGCTVAYDPRVRTMVEKERPGRISTADNTGNWLRYIDLRIAIRKHLRSIDATRFRAELRAVDQYLFMAIHLLAQQDLGLAVELYQKHLPTGFVPEPSAAITKRYILAHRTLGFEMAVRLGQLLNIRGVPAKRAQ